MILHCASTWISLHSTESCKCGSSELKCDGRKSVMNLQCPQFSCRLYSSSASSLSLAEWLPTAYVIMWSIGNVNHPETSGRLILLINIVETMCLMIQVGEKIEMHQAGRTLTSQNLLCCRMTEISHVRFKHRTPSWVGSLALECTLSMSHNVRL